MSDMLQRGVLTLKGKRITGFSVALFHPEDMESQIAEPTYGGNETIQYIDMSLIEQLRESEHVYHYLKNGEIIPCEEIIGVFDKESITDSAGDTALYTLETEEETEFTISQATGHSVQSFTVTKKPVDGKIVLTIDSRLIGEVRVFGVSETRITSLAKLRVTEGASQ